MFSRFIILTRIFRSMKMVLSVWCPTCLYTAPTYVDSTNIASFPTMPCLPPHHLSSKLVPHAISDNKGNICSFSHTCSISRSFIHSLCYTCSFSHLCIRQHIHHSTPDAAVTDYLYHSSHNSCLSPTPAIRTQRNSITN